MDFRSNFTIYRAKKSVNTDREIEFFLKILIFMEQTVLSLKKILDLCADPVSKEWENAWVQLLSRYKKLIYHFINKSCNSWQIARLNLQRSAVIDDIFSDVIYLLYDKIETFKNRNSEQKFISWLQIICSRATSRYMKRIIKQLLTEDNIEEFQDYKDSFGTLKSWELYEDIVSLLRTQLKNRFAERDIHIFMLNIWAGFQPKHISEHPCFTDLKLNNIEVIISRTKKNIKNNRSL